MTEHDEVTRSAIFNRLAQSRQELRALLEPAPAAGSDGNAPAGDHRAGFPRSRTMQMLMSGKGLGTLGAVASGLIIARPALALRLLRLLPASAVARTMLVKAFSAWRAKQD